MARTSITIHIDSAPEEIADRIYLYANAHEAKPDSEVVAARTSFQVLDLSFCGEHVSVFMTTAQLKIFKERVANMQVTEV